MHDFSITTTARFHEIYPDARVGIMVLDAIKCPAASEKLDENKLEIETALRQRFTDKSILREQPVLQAYRSYYKLYQKTYHVQSQLESVIFGGRSIPSVTPVVEAMFMAELDNMLLTAGHDLASLESPLLVDLGNEESMYTLMNGIPQNLKNNDMCMRDQQGYISSVIHGPDQRTRLSPTTSNALFVVYAPEGIQEELIKKHFSDIFRYVTLFSPVAYQEYLEIL